MLPGAKHITENTWRIAALLAFAVGLGAGCKGPAGTSCTVAQNTDGSATITCDDGTTATVANGTDGTSCSVADNSDGTATITCGDQTYTVENGTNGTVGTNGTDGTDGNPGLNAAQDFGLDVQVALNDPANGTYYAAGEQIVVTFTLTDSRDDPVLMDELSTASLYMSGPWDVTSNVAAVGLLNTSGTSVNLLTTTNSNLVVDGNVWTYTMEPITSEAAGEYTIGLRAIPDGYPYDGVFALKDLKIGEDADDTRIVGGCENCHLGEANGQYYFHHVDPSSRSPTGSPEREDDPVRSCFMCHNTDGPAEIYMCDDGSLVTRDNDNNRVCATGNLIQVGDAIVRRVHGIHMGAMLKAPRDTDSQYGLFADYTDVVFPADVRNCTECHKDTTTNTWKTNPSPLACGACHDDVDFRPPPDGTNANHCQEQYRPSCDGAPITGAATGCTNCHSASSIAGYHDPSAGPSEVAIQNPPDFPYTVTLSVECATASDTGDTGLNTGPCVQDDEPTVKIDISDDVGPVDPTVEFQYAADTGDKDDRFDLFVSGPRDTTKPVLTDAADNPINSAHYNNNNLLYPFVDANSRITMEGDTLKYRLDPIDLSTDGNVKPGTYTVFVRVEQRDGSGNWVEPTSWGIANFQIGTDTEEPFVASHCTDCHGDTRMHTSPGYASDLDFNPDICKSCHDYQRNYASSTGWDDNNAGFSTPPLSKWIHNVHKGHYLDPSDPVASEFSDIIFPQDLRNCVKCHRDSDDWRDEPNRMACYGCHDTPGVEAHFAIMTDDPTPLDPFSGDEVESCAVCHTDNADWAVEAVHNITDPYKPPYPRE